MTWIEYESGGRQYRSNQQTDVVQVWQVAENGAHWLTIAERGQSTLTAKTEREAAPIALPDASSLPDGPTKYDVRYTTSRRDAAIGFSIKTWQLGLAACFALFGLRLAIGAPVTIASASVLLFFGFAGAWLIAFVVDAILSPDGIALYHSAAGWRYLRREQQHRHDKDANL